MSCQVEPFLANGPFFDVRSPAEYSQGHIPGAIHLPLFSDKERSLVGTCYKQVSRQEAIALGLEFAANKIHSLIDSVCAYPHCAIYCWRGGMRSSSVAALLQTLGKSTTTLSGGYKSYRHWVISQLAKERHFILLGGLTGSGKTQHLHTLAEQGEQCLDLEALACHRGSTFGMLGQGTQPSQEHFENLIASTLARFDNRPIFVEDESRLIGTCKIPDPLFAQMGKSSIVLVCRPIELRIELLVQDYSQFPQQELAKSITRIGKRLGPERTWQALKALQAQDYWQVVRLLLSYYDRTYEESLKKRLHRVSATSFEPF